MSSRLASLCLSSSLLAGAALAGCTDEPAVAPEPEAPRFADASPAQLARTFQAASGGDLRAALQLGRLFAGAHDPTECPRIELEEPVTTLTGGCTRETGARIEGSIVIHGLLESPSDSPLESSVELDFRSAVPRRGDSILAGRLELVEGPAYSLLSGELKIDTAGIASTSNLGLYCDARECVLAPNAEIEITGLGRVRVKGAWSVGPEPAGSLTVIGGDDLLVFDLGGVGADGCVPYAVGEQRGTVCVPKIAPQDWFEPPAPFPGAQAAAAEITADDGWESPPAR